MTGGSDQDHGVIFEFIPLGNAVKVSAVDTATGVEVSIVGPASATRDQLETVALKKLRWRIEADTG